MLCWLKLLPFTMRACLLFRHAEAWLHQNWQTLSRTWQRGVTYLRLEEWLFLQVLKNSVKKLLFWEGMFNNHHFFVSELCWEFYLSSKNHVLLVTPSPLNCSLPAVPQLEEVPYVSFQCNFASLEEQIGKSVQSLGRVSRMGPVQITQMDEKPGALLLHWEEVSILLL